MPDAQGDRERHLGLLVHEQAALRRVATLVARGVSPEELFSAVSDEVGRLFDAEAAIARFEPDGSAMVVVGLTRGIPVVTIGKRWELEDFLASAAVYRTGRPARNHHTGHHDASGPVADDLRQMDFVSTVAAPIVVEGGVWGVMTVSDQRKPLPPDTEDRVERFTELVATAVANAESRAELAASEARARELAREQAALRRVATLVARGARPPEVFSLVSDEVAQVFDAEHVAIGRYDADGTAMTIVGLTPGILVVTIGTRLPLVDSLASTTVYRTGLPARTDHGGVPEEPQLSADYHQLLHGLSTVATPIVVDDRLWGVLTISDRRRPLPAQTEERAMKFTELVAMAIANADSREELAASRVRIVAAADDARRRIERDLHDGAQQRLVTLAVALRRAEARIPAELGTLSAELGRVAEGLTIAVDELRELSRGIHPSILTEGGLSPALKALGRRSAVRVKLDVGFECRLPDHVEVAAYYTVSEALTNASKHADASRVWVAVRLEGNWLVLSIRDDGIGGADTHRGSGLIGLIDRLEALGGTVRLESPPGSGTSIRVQIPIPQ
jgi:signal transduction histidine kinase